MANFADRLAEAVQRRGTSVLVGLDPRWEQLPEQLRGSGSGQKRDQQNYVARAGAFRQFCCEVIDVVAPLVPAVKPQAAFFEQLGPAGMSALYDVIAHARQK